MIATRSHPAPGTVPQDQHGAGRSARLHLCFYLCLCALALSACGNATPDPPSTPVTVSISEPGAQHPGNRPRPPWVEPAVRVRVLATDSDEGPWQFGELGQKLLLLDGLTRKPSLLEAPIEVGMTAGVWSIHDDADRMLRYPGRGVLSLRTLAGKPDLITFQGRQLNGKLELVPHSGDSGKIDLVTRIPIEQYLPGVLQGELYGHWKPAAFAAQAVAARSYAVAEAAFWRPRRHFDLVAGPASQAWTGMTASDRAINAVEATRGVLLLFDDLVVPAYYSASCGGRSASAKQAISPQAGHLIQPLEARVNDTVICCEAAPVRAWSSSFDLDALALRLQARGRQIEDSRLAGLGRLKSVALVSTNPAGRALRFELQDHEGQRARIDAEPFRRLLGTVPRSNGSPASLLKSSDIRARVNGRTLRVTGSGYGHGVGLCQYGAQAMASEGADWKAILARYYPGAIPTVAWGDADLRN
jgi:stage II sporulation protein D